MLVLALAPGCLGVIAGEPSGSTGGDGSATGTGGSGGGGLVTFCDVQPLLQARCWSCHGASGVTPLTSVAQLAAASPAGGTFLDRAIARMSAEPVTTAMPPSVGGAAADIALLKAWRDNALAGCNQNVGDGGTGGGGASSEAPIFPCDVNAQQAIAPLLRLSDEEYRTSLASVLSAGLTASEVRAGLAAIAARLSALPADGTSSGEHLTYDTQDQRISRLLVEPQVLGAIELAEWLAADTGRLARFVKAFAGAASCPTTDAAGCVTSFIERFGKVALRRPVDSDEATALNGFYADAQYGGYKAVIVGVLTMPAFLFRTEFKGAAVAGQSDAVTLTSWELASRLSYSLTGAPPDAALVGAAEVDFTGAGKTLEEQARRLLRTTEGKRHLERFFTQWLRSDRVPVIDSTARAALPLAYPDRADSVLPLTTDLNALRDDAFAELVTLMTEVTNSGGSLHDALLSEQSYARSRDLASVYGVQPWPRRQADGGTQLPDGGVDKTPVFFPAGQRAGLFTRAGFLLSGFADANPIKRGARLRVEYLCDLLVPPDNINLPATYVPAVVPTPRTVAIAKTEIPLTACAGCHKTQINPLGFALENYDAFGRYRTQELVGGTTTWVPVNATSTPWLPPANAEIHSGRELSATLADAAKFNACFARHVFRFSQGREEAPVFDGCGLQAVQASARTQSIQEAFVSLARQPAFTTRRLAAEN